MSGMKQRYGMCSCEMKVAGIINLVPDPQAMQHPDWPAALSAALSQCIGLQRNVACRGEVTSQC